MSHNVRMETYKENVNKEKVEKEWDAFVRHEDYEEGAHGLPARIRWIDVVCDSYEEAEAYIEKHDRGWYDQLAVKYKSYRDFEPTKKYEALTLRCTEAERSLFELNSKVHYRDVKSKFVSCRNCESKIATAYLKGNYCPVCHADLRPASLQERLKKLNDLCKKLNKELKEEEKKLKEKNMEICWLLKIEYHT